MYTNFSLFILLSHALVSLNGTAQSDFPPDPMLQAWMFFSVLVVAPNILHTNSVSWEHRGMVLNKYVLQTCFCIMFNTMLSVTTCNMISYCYLVHSMASISLAIAADNIASHSLRVIMIFSFIAILFCIQVFPKPLQFSSLSLFTNTTATQYAAVSFETAHLWAMALTIVSNLLSDTMNSILRH